MKALTATVLAIVLASAAGAQAQRIETMLPVPPLPPIGLPLPHIGLTPAEQNKTTSPTPATGTTQQRTDLPITVGGVGYLPPYFYLAPWYFTPPAAAVTRTEAPAGRSAEKGGPEALPATGTLWLDVQPAAAMQVFVDGFYVGSTDLTGNGIELEAGPHRVQLKAIGFEPIDFDVRITRQQTITYRDTLKASTRASEPKLPSAAPRTKMYVIPGCYAGNLPPDDVALPEGCDAAKATTIER
jgi:hypothetical protein